MEPLKAEIEALAAVLMQPLDSFVTEKERDEKGEEWAEKTAQRRMFSQAIKAVDKMRGERTLYHATIKFGPVWFQNFGPYATAKKAGEALEELRSHLGNLVQGAAVTRSIHPSGWEAMKAKADAPPAGNPDLVEVRLDAEAFKRGWNGKQATRQQYLESA